MTSEDLGVCVTGALQWAPFFASYLDDSLSGHGADSVDGCCIYEVSGRGCCGEAISYVAATFETRGLACDQGLPNCDLGLEKERSNWSAASRKAIETDCVG